jgi:hypothetical protein
MSDEISPRTGEMAPDFELPNVRGGCFRLSVHRGDRPVLITFGSITGRRAAGVKPALLHLFSDFIDRLEVVTVYVREEHPSEQYPQPTDLDRKKLHASDWVEVARIPWTVVVDGLEGEVEELYGSRPDAACLVGSDGRVVFHGPWDGDEASLRGRVEALLG